MPPMSDLPRAVPPPLPPAALVYPTGGAEALPLAAFAADLSARGFRVGGLVQTTERDSEGFKQSITGIDVGSGERTVLARYKGDRRVDAECGFDPAALAAATRAVRAAVAAEADIIVIEKFGRQEQDGGGLRDEILSALAAGIPTVTAVSSTALGPWSAMLGGLDVYLPPTLSALWKWWGPHRIYDDLERGVGEGIARRVVVGFNWTLVEGEHGCGIAQTPNRGQAGCEAVPGAGNFAGRPLRELAALVHSWNPAEAAVGLAAINAFHNRADLPAGEGNGLDAFARFDGPVSVIGHFGGLEQHLPGCRIIEREPADGDYPATATGWLLRDSEGVVATASTLVDHGLPEILGAAAGKPFALVGPSTPMTPRLHAYGVSVLAGLIVTDPEGAARAVAEGGAFRALKPFTRRVALHADASAGP